MQWRGRALEAVLFDLDGTLLDTAADIAEALNRAMAERGWPPIAPGEVRRMIGRGSPALIERAAAFQGRELDEAAKAAMLERFFHHYRISRGVGRVQGRALCGRGRVLARAARGGSAHRRGHQQAGAFRDAGSCRRSALRDWVDYVVGGDSCPRRKPDPAPLLFACEQLGAAPAHALMVGDSINDVQAARGAGIPVVCVPYGYNEGKDPRLLPCDAFVESLADLPGLLGWEPVVKIPG